MKLLINTATTFKGGGVQVACSFIEDCRNFDQNEYHVILSESVADNIDTRDYPPNFFFYTIGYRPATRVFSFRSRDRDLKRIEKKVNPEAIFTTTGPAYWRPKAPHLVGYNLPHYIYSESPFFNQISLYKFLKWKLKGKLIKKFLKNEADAIVVQTDDVNDRLREMLKTDEVFTVTNTFNQHYLNPKQAAPKLPQKKDGEFRFLTLSAWYAHKNLGIISEILEELPNTFNETIKFVLTLPDEDFNKHFPSNKNLINVGPVEPEEGPSLYQECDAMFLPTLLECFSASYAEAMIMEKPILTTDLGFARTVCGDAALYYSPVDANDAARKVQLLTSDSALKAKLIQKAKKWVYKFDSPRDRTVKYLDLCRQLSAGGTRFN